MLMIVYRLGIKILWSFHTIEAVGASEVYYHTVHTFTGWLVAVGK